MSALRPNEFSESIRMVPAARAQALSVLEDRPNGPAEPPLYIVGIGASAGGLEALESFFDHVPADSGLAFVVVQHLSPDFKSLMDELLRRHTAISIHRVEDGMVVERNAIYLIPPKKEMIISQRRLLLTDKDPSGGLTLPIDTFFRSLAQDVRERAVAIVLSGTGSDGSRGIRDVHAAGGLVIAQSPESARFDGMPRSAIDTGVVDFVLSPGQMPQVLMSYVRQPGERDQIIVPGVSPVSEDSMNAIFQILRDEHGIDFSHYKPSTVSRRVERRLQMNRAQDLEQYVEQLRSDRDERNSLYRDLLIGVTQFFRDPEAFARLEREVLPPLLSKLPPDVDARIWVAGCATGEEAYSLGILIHEYFESSKRPLNVRIFATDVHRASLDYASAGHYSRESVAEVTPKRLERYFTRSGNGYQVVEELRKLIVFAAHDVIKDAPFTRLDLISCRNLLIYFQPLAQKKALSLFHFALRPGGVLFLGPSESPGEISEEFEELDRHWKIYRKRRDVRLPADTRLPLLRGASARLRTSGTPGLSASPALPDVQQLRAYDALLDEFVPPSMLVNERRELVHTFAGAGDFLVHRDGRPSSDILDLVDHDLKVAVAGAIQRAIKEGTPVSYGGIRAKTSNGVQQVRLSVKPLSNRGTPTGFLLVSLETQQPLPQQPAAEQQDTLDLRAESRQRLEAMETELQYTKENLQAAIEELETSNEELQAANEELLASNEELQSTNEELHSVNEELYTVNAEYQRKIAELTELTGDMDNLLRSTDVALIFIDRNLCIRKFTPHIARTFQLVPQDIGRPIDAFSHGIDYPGLLDEVRRVLQTEQPFEREVRDREGNYYLLRILPYQQKCDVEGVVLTLIDIAAIKQNERQLRLLSKVFSEAADAIIVEDFTGRIVDLNPEAERTYGYAREELLGQPASILTPPGQQELLDSLRARCRAGEAVRNVEILRRHKDGRCCPELITLSLLSGEADQPAALVSLSKDLTRLKQAEQERERHAVEVEQANAKLREEITQREKAEAIAREAVARRDQFLAMLSHELRNPLSAVLSATYLLDGGQAPAEEARKAAGVIERQAAHMARLLDDLLDVARLAQGKIEIRRRLVDLRTILREAVASAQQAISARSHQFRFEPSQEPLWVDGDPARLLQVYENLLTNAAKYTPPGGQIELQAGRQGEHCVVRVRDTGVGIPQDMLGPIFELFVQSSATLDRAEGGMGVGLTLVKSLVELHGGSITAHSDGPGKGSLFTVTLPLAAPPASEGHAPQPPAEAAPLAHGSASGLKVLVVEDNADSREMLSSLLQLYGCQVFAAADGQKGLELLCSQRPQLALVDVGLPALDGYEFARRVRGMPGINGLRLVALTGYGRAEDRRAALDAGFDEHLVKPLRVDELRRVLGRAAQAGD